MKNLSASVLAIGTELTTGQILNKNASTLSEKLKRFSVLTRLHLTVPDEWDLMTNGLQQCADQTDLIFITGGLGPTSDDFTRDVVSKWCNLPLVWDEASWLSLNERLVSRGYGVKEIQKQQCYFPEGARILRNSEGTANGFHVSAHGKEIFVLPGPPREIEACWQFGIKDWLEQKTAGLEKYQTHSWDTLGIGESDLALLVEPLIADFKNQNSDLSKKLDIGYRVHLPYVEFKLSFYSAQMSISSSLELLIEHIDQTLKSWTILKNGLDIAELLSEKINELGITSIAICDEVTGTYLLNRLNPQVKRWKNLQHWSFSNHLIPQSASMNMDRGLLLHISEVDAHTAEISMIYRGQVRRDRVSSPYKTANMKERSLQYYAEFALILWQRWMD